MNGDMMEGLEDWQARAKKAEAALAAHKRLNAALEAEEIVVRAELAEAKAKSDPKGRWRLAERASNMKEAESAIQKMPNASSEHDMDTIERGHAMNTIALLAGTIDGVKLVTISAWTANAAVELLQRIERRPLHDCPDQKPRCLNCRLSEGHDPDCLLATVLAELIEAKP